MGTVAIAGPLIGSARVCAIGWELVFWLNLPIGGLTMLLVMQYFAKPLQRYSAGGVDALRTGLLGSGIGSGMAALIQWDTPGTGALAPLWGLCGVLSGVLIIELTAFLSPAVQGLFGRSVLAAGLVLGVMMVSWSIASMGFGCLLVQWSLRRVALIEAAALVACSSIVAQQ